MVYIRISLIPSLPGVFSWITINYLLGRFDHTSPTGSPEPAAIGAGGANDQQLLLSGAADMKETAAMNRMVYTITTVGSLDMGGASLQVAFEIPHNVRNLYCCLITCSYSVHNCLTCYPLIFLCVCVCVCLCVCVSVCVCVCVCV